MPLSRAQKNVMRGNSSGSKKGDVTNGPPISTKKGVQYSWPKDLAAVGPHYKQKDLGVEIDGDMKPA